MLAFNTPIAYEYALNTQDEQYSCVKYYNNHQEAFCRFLGLDEGMSTDVDGSIREAYEYAKQLDMDINHMLMLMLLSKTYPFNKSIGVVKDTYVSELEWLRLMSAANYIVAAFKYAEKAFSAYC